MTGATGFIGGALAMRLRSEGWHVKALVRDIRRGEHLAGIELAVGDILKPETLPPAMKGVDVLFHAAALVDLVKPKRQEIVRNNVEGTRNVLQAAKDAGIRKIVYFSSVAAIGRKHTAADETTWNDGDYSNAYEESKHKSEQVALAFGKDPKLHIVHILPSVVIGPGDPKTGAFFKRFLRGKIPAVPRKDGRASFVHIDDLLDGVMLALAKGKRNERYIFVQQTYSTTEVFAEMARLTGQKAPRRIPMWVAYAGAGLEEARAWASRRPPVVSREAVRLATMGFGYRADKAKKELGWKPKDFGERFAATLRHWQAEVDRKKAMGHHG